MNLSEEELPKALQKHAEEENVKSDGKNRNNAIRNIFKKKERHGHKYKIRAWNHAAEYTNQGVHIIQLEH